MAALVVAFMAVTLSHSVIKQNVLFCIIAAIVTFSLAVAGYVTNEAESRTKKKKSALLDFLLSKERFFEINRLFQKWQSREKHNGVTEEDFMSKNGVSRTELLLYYTPPYYRENAEELEAKPRG
jgi:Na+-translocating ferredoxin:NAD+ oxidoreductase RnfG subunit